VDVGDSPGWSMVMSPQKKGYSLPTTTISFIFLNDTEIIPHSSLYIPPCSAVIFIVSDRHCHNAHCTGGRFRTTKQEKKIELSEYCVPLKKKLIHISSFLYNWILLNSILSRPSLYDNVFSVLYSLNCMCTVVLRQCIIPKYSPRYLHCLVVVYLID